MNVKDLAARMDALEAENADLKTQITNMKAGDSVSRKAEPADKPKPPTKTFEVNGANYRFLYPTYINADRQRVSAKDQLDNPKELERLVTIKSGIIQKVD